MCIYRKLKRRHDLLPGKGRNYNDYSSALSVAEQLGQEGYQALLLKADVISDETRCL